MTQACAVVVLNPLLTAWITVQVSTQSGASWMPGGMVDSIQVVQSVISNIAFCYDQQHCLLLR